MLPIIFTNGFTRVAKIGIVATIVLFNAFLIDLHEENDQFVFHIDELTKGISNKFSCSVLFVFPIILQAFRLI